MHHLNLSRRALPLLAGGLLAATFGQAPLATAWAQGCVAIRGSSMCNLQHFGEPADADLATGDWLVSLGFRWFQSDRHFVGDVEQKHRQEIGNEVINDTYFWDINVQYAINERWSVSLTLPFTYSDRSSWYEHDRVSRSHSQAGGLADIRLTTYAWIWKPAPELKGNVQLGLGLKAPTGEYDATDLFYTADGPVIGYVDQSIQPGDGGWGFSVEILAYRQLLPRLTAFVQGSYLFNPRTENGTPTVTGRPRGNPYEQVMSVTDQYFGHGGLVYTVVPKWGLSAGVAGRIDGVPAEDALGSSDGFRRPGYAVSVEPLVQWMKGRYTASLAVPIAVYRNRTRSVADKKWTEDTGIYRAGDAAFADYSVAANFSIQF